MGLAPWPTSQRRETLLDRWGGIDIVRLGGFSVRQLAVISLVWPVEIPWEPAQRLLSDETSEHIRLMVVRRARESES